MKLPLFVLAIIFSSAFAKDSFTIGERPRGVECIADNETIRVDLCNVKAYSRKIAVYNVAITFLKSVERPIYVQGIFFYRFGTIYREMLNSGVVELCDIIERKTINLILYRSLESLWKSVPNLVHECPLKEGRLIFCLILNKKIKFMLVSEEL